MSDKPSTPPGGPGAKGRPAADTSGRGNKPGTTNATGRDATASSAGVPSAAELASSSSSSAAASSAAAPILAATAPVPPSAAAPSGGTGPSSAPAMPPRPPAAPAKRFEPAILPIAAALIVLVGAIAYLLSSPRATVNNPVALQQADAARMNAVDTRLAALEARPSAAGFAERAAATERRLDAAETTVRELGAKPIVDADARAGVTALTAAVETARNASAEGLKRLEERLAALDARTQEERRQADARLAALDTRAQEDARRTEARIAQAEATLANRLTGAEQSLAARVTAAEQAFAPRLAALDAALNQRVEAAGQSMAQRLDAAGKSLDERLARAEAGVNERMGQQEAALAQRVQGFEQRLAQAEAAERRLTALAARGTIQAALEAGRPLGQALSGLPGTPPVALTRYRDAAPPTEAALRLSFEDAARAARVAAEPQGQSVTDTALSRLQGLVTVRRGEQVVVGDAVSGELERARRSLDAGDLSGAVERLEKLPAPSRDAMAGWIGQARELVEARVALRDIGTGSN
ncbi:mitofilin family membrane protein [Muricoccus aerilatus]|uniref:mitofilin family membrane protein n=1 Tax=Muricoccus aerilatus TaxID=452982 RepID=UPI0005C14078|nr:mitofilin family membrane protein [Roseomonas aerilata]